MGIHYELREYEVDPNDLAAETVAAKIGLPPEQVFKTLVARGDRCGLSMAVIPGDQELDLKALAAISGERKIQLVPVKELQALTGYIRGRGDGPGGQTGFSGLRGRDDRTLRRNLRLGGYSGRANPDRSRRLSACNQRQTGRPGTAEKERLSKQKPRGEGNLRCSPAQ